MENIETGRRGMIYMSFSWQMVSNPSRENRHSHHSFPKTLQPFRNQHSERNNALQNCYSCTSTHISCVAPHSCRLEGTCTNEPRWMATTPNGKWPAVLYMDGLLVKHLNSTEQVLRVGGYHKLGNILRMAGQAEVCVS